jgi:hypothetical protein
LCGGRRYRGAAKETATMRVDFVRVRDSIHQAGSIIRRLSDAITFTIAKIEQTDFHVRRARRHFVRNLCAAI